MVIEEQGQMLRTGDVDASQQFFCPWSKEKINQIYRRRLIGAFLGFVILGLYFTRDVPWFDLSIASLFKWLWLALIPLVIYFWDRDYKRSVKALIFEPTGFRYIDFFEGNLIPWNEVSSMSEEEVNRSPALAVHLKDDKSLFSFLPAGDQVWGAIKRIYARRYESGRLKTPYVIPLDLFELSHTEIYKIFEQNTKDMKKKES